MPTNPHFQYFTFNGEQELAESLVMESIKQYGLDVKYLPKTLVDQDFIFGEDRFMKYNLAVDVEVYIKNINGFEGEGDFLSKFNLEIRDQITFTMSRRRWSQIAAEKLLDEHSYVLQQEEVNNAIYGASEGFLLEEGTANGYSITTSRPMEGDLIFFPLNQKLYEIKFVEHETMFYQHGKLYTYDITCELFDRDSRLDTGNTAIDSIETTFSLDILFNKLLQENGDVIMDENGGYIITEFRLEDTAKSANNESIQIESYDVVDFSERNLLLDYE